MLTITVNNNKISGTMIENSKTMSDKVGRKENSNTCSQWREIRGKEHLNTINQNYFKRS